MGISFDTPEENKAFAEKFDFPFLLLSDSDRRIGLEYGAAKSENQEYAERISILIDPGGAILRVFDTVDVQAHAKHVLGALS